MDGTPQTNHGILARAVRAALVVALTAGVWSVHRRLPQDDRGGFDDAQPAATNLRVRLRRSTIKFPIAEGKIPLQLYPINREATRSEYYSERRPGVSLEDFEARRMGDRKKMTGELDEHGEAVITVPPGRWWVHATVNGAQELTWRLPVNVTGREVTVELTYENTYLRAKRF